MINTKCEDCGSKAVGVVPIHDKTGKWIGNKELCKGCIEKLPNTVTKKGKKPVKKSKSGKKIKNGRND